MSATNVRAASDRSRRRTVRTHRRAPGARQRSALRLLVAPALLGVLLAGVLAAPGAASLPTVDPGATGPEQLPVTVTVPSLDGTDGSQRRVVDAQLRWALNHETGSAAFFGGCNFLIAGKPGVDGDTGGGKVWTAADNFYRASEGDVRIVRQAATGPVEATFAERCQGPDGTPVTLANNATSGTQVVVGQGTGWVDPEAGTLEIRWTGTFTTVFYGGLTYWWASDPVLTVRADGTGELRATAGGYGTSMEDMTKWEALPATSVVLASLGGVDLASGAGFSTTPRYLGESVRVPAGLVQQAERGAVNEAYWGSFPQSFVDFQVRTGQAAYWYTSGGQRDWAKVPDPVYVSYDAQSPVPQVPGTSVTPPTGMVSNPVLRPPTAAGAGTGLLQNGAPGLVTPAAPTDTAAPFAFPATAARTLGGQEGQGGLVPALGALGATGDRLALLSTGLLLASAGTVLGFRKGWLVLPFRG